METSVVLKSGIDDGSDTAADSSSGCDTHNKSVIAWVEKKTRLFEYKSSTYWCWDGSEITIDPVWQRYAYERQNFVKFVRHTHTDENGEAGDVSHYDYTRGHFKSCLSALKLICPFNYRPWIEKLQYHDGDTWEDTGN